MTEGDVNAPSGGEGDYFCILWLLFVSKYDLPEAGSAGLGDGKVITPSDLCANGQLSYIGKLGAIKNRLYWTRHGRI